MSKQEITWDVQFTDAAKKPTPRRVSGDFPTVNHLRAHVEQSFPELTYVSAEAVNPEVRPDPTPKSARK